MKGIVKYFWKGSSEEKTPFAWKASSKFAANGNIPKDSQFADHGSIPKNSKMGVEEDTRQLKDVAGDSEIKPKMTLLRKLCFLLSLNGGVVYVAALLWFIPCRQPFCKQPQKEWSANISARVTTNLETINYAGVPPSVVFGYSDEEGANLASLAISDGRMSWNKSTDHILRHVFCQLDGPSSTRNQAPFCVMTSSNYIGAFNASNGEMLWEHNITNPNGEAIDKISLIEKQKKEKYLFGIDDTLLFVLNADNGTIISTTTLPCSWTIDIKLAGPWKTLNGTVWTVVCEYGDSIEVWTFEEKEILSPPPTEGTDDPLLRNDVQFKLLFSRESYIGSIDLAGDVTTTPDSLALSWADIVVMVTAQAPFHHLHRTWERRFSGPLGDPLAVTSITSGRFTDLKENQIAVSVQDGLNSTIHILETKNGTTVHSFSLGMRSVMSMETILGGKDETDAILCETVQETEVNSSSTLSSTRTYFTMKYRNKKIVYQKVLTSELYASKMSQFSDGAADLFTARQTQNGDTIVTRHPFTIKHSENTCDENSSRESSKLPSTM